MNKKWLVAILAVLMLLVIVVVFITVTSGRDVNAPPSNETTDGAMTENEIDLSETNEPDDVAGVVDDWDDEATVNNNSAVDDLSDNNENSDNNEDSSNGTDNTITTPPSPPVTDFNAGGKYTYEQYTALSASEQQSYYETFDTPEEFFAWYSAVKDAYEANKKTNELEDGSVDIGDIIENMQ